jgi:hypothetical protein
LFDTSQRKRKTTDSDDAPAPRKRAATKATKAASDSADDGAIGGVSAEDWKNEAVVKKLTIPVLKEYLAVC